MPWAVRETKEINLKGQGYTINVTNTGFNLLFEIYEHFFGRIFFSVDYWPDIKKAIRKTCTDALKGCSTREEVIITAGKNKKLVVRFKKRKLNNMLISRMASDNRGLTWIVERDKGKMGQQYRRIRIPINKADVHRILSAIDKFYEMIEKGDIQRPKSEGFDLYYANEMAKHDRSMLAFKEYLDDHEFTFFIRLDENIKNSEKAYKIARGRVAQEAAKAGISFLPEKRGDDGFIRLNNENIVVDWEIRRDWVGNYNNIPIRYDDRNNAYHAVEYPPPNPGTLKKPLSPDFDSLKKIKDFMEKRKLHNEKPYFIYQTLGQFDRKMKKPEIMLSIQCAQASPQWPKTTNPPAGAFFVVAWHQDFRIAGTVTRTTDTGAGERGDYWDCDNYAIFEFNKEGVEKFKKIIKKQYSGGLENDRNGNSIPRNREWT